MYLTRKTVSSHKYLKFLLFEKYRIAGRVLLILKLIASMHLKNNIMI